MPERLSNPSRPSGLRADLAFVYLLHLARLLFPIGFLAVLTARYDQGVTAGVLTAQSLAIGAAQVIEYGFGIAGVRDLSVLSTTAARTPPVSRIVSAQVLLLAPCVLVTVVLAWASPIVGTDAGLLAATMLIVVGLGFSPAWYLQGTDRAKLASGYEALSLALSLTVLLAASHVSDSMTWAVAAAASGPCLSALLGWRVVLRELRPRFDARAGLAAIREVFALFVVRASVTTYTAASTFIASLLTTPAQTASFGAAIRVIGALSNLYLPLIQVALPRIVRARHEGHADQARLLKGIGIVFVAAALSMIAALQLTADWISVVLFSGVVAPRDLRSLSLVLLPICGSLYLTAFVHIPAGRDRLIATTTVSGALLMLLISAWATPLHGALGMTFSRGIGECYAVLVFIGAWWFSRPPSPNRHVAA